MRDVRNPIRANADWPKAVIAGAYQTGVLGVRSLVRRGVPTACVDWDDRNPGFRSVYCKAQICPNPTTDSEAWVDFMLRLSDKLSGRPVLIASSDQYVTAIAEHVDALDQRFILSPAARLQGLLASKKSQYELAARHGMPMPRTHFAHSIDDVDAFARDATFPCLIKPMHFREWHVFPSGHPLSHVKVAVANTAEELRRSWLLASVANPDVVLQEVIVGSDTAKRVYLSCYDRSSQRIANALFRELRCDPLGFGPASVSEPVSDQEADDVCDRFLKAIGYVGICEIEVKRDVRDGRVKLIEANPRLSGGGDAAPYAGVDLCWLHYLDLVGEQVTPVGPNGRDFRHIVLRSDIGTIIAYRRAGMLPWSDLVHSYKPPLAFYDLDVRDWRYSAETLYLVARTSVREALGSLFSERRRT